MKFSSFPFPLRFPTQSGADALRGSRLVLAAFLLLAGQRAFCQVSSDFEVKDRVLIRYHGRDEEVAIPESLGINRIGEKAFAGNALRSVKIPVGVNAVESRAFAGCVFLTAVSLPNTVTRIGYRAFFGCSFLENISIPRSLREIGGGAFLNCRSLPALELPSALRSVGPRAFSGCTGLQNLSLSRRTRIGEHAFMGVPPGAVHYRD
jgi:hypothetical protein